MQFGQYFDQNTVQILVSTLITLGRQATGNPSWKSIGHRFEIQLETQVGNQLEKSIRPPTGNQIWKSIGNLI